MKFYTLSSCLVLLLIRFELTSSEDSNTVTVPNGSKFNGITLTSVHAKKTYVEFRGIPYAKPPIKDLRFKPPILLDEDLGTKDATEYGDICLQLDPWYDPDEVEGGSWEEMKTLGSEDCLFVNIATSSTKPRSPLPVLVWFHGGNFQSESGQDYGFGKLMDHDLVAVNFNYRLGVLGFLNTQNDLASGNMDQTVLLQWVKRNIAAFGGDPNSITVAGHNAGAVSINLHMISDLSKDLFHRAIMQSGTAISPWVFMKDPSKNNEKLAKLLKCGNDTDISECLFSSSGVSFVQKTYRMTEWFLDPMTPFGPSKETSGKAMEKFLSKNPYSLLQEGAYWAKDVPTIMGVNSHEGLLHAMDIGHVAMLRMVFNMEWFRAAPISLYYKTTALDAYSVSESVRHYYFPLNKTNDENDSITPVQLVDKNYKFDNLTQMYSDRHFFIPLHHSAKLMGKSNRQLYLYWFDYVSNQSIHGIYGYNSSHIFGPSHYDQMQYLFVTPFFNETKGEEHIQFEKHLLKGVHRFIKGGLLEKGWVPVTSEMVEDVTPLLYNRIGKPSGEIHIKEPFTERVHFWNSLFIMEYDKESFIDNVMETHDSSNGNIKDEL